MNGLNFANPWMLALLWLVPLAAFGLALLRRRRRRQGEVWVSALMRERLAPKGRSWRFGFQLACLTAAFLLAVVALARPRWGAVEEIVTRSGRDLMIVLDVSRSMLAEDVPPNRLERAKTDLIDLIDTLDGDRAGLILFRHKAVQVCPLTTDYGFLLHMLDAAAPDSCAPGETDIGDAIDKALDALDAQQSAHQAIVLVSDGEDLAEQALDGADRARQRKITIFTVGYGSPSGGAIPDPNGGRMQYRGQDVMSRLDAAMLGKIAARTGGVYVPVGAARTDLGDLYRNHLRKRAARELDETMTRRQIERFSWFLLPAILALLAAAAVSAGRPFVRAAEKRNATPAQIGLLLLLLIPASLQAAGTNAPPTARQAQALYRQGRYAEAAEAYRQAAAANARESDRNRYNEGCALAAAGRHKEAAERFLSLLTAPASIADPARYNQGCALLQAADAGDAWKTNAAAAQARAESIQAAAQAFQDVLQAEGQTRAADARHNLSQAAERADAARQQARALKLEERYGGMDAGQLAWRLLEGQRKIGLSAAAAYTNPAPSQLSQLEAVGAEQRDLAELMIPFSAKLDAALQQAAGQGGTNAAQQAAQMRQFTQALGELLNQTADRLRDADPEAVGMLPAGEQAAYSLWKGIAPFEQLLGEDIRVQSNAMRRAQQARQAEPVPPEARSMFQDQVEAAQLTRLFAERFEQTVPESGMPAPPLPPSGATNENANALSNAPGITPETRAKILDLARKAVLMQGDADQAIQEKDWGAAHTLARDSHAILKEIEDLLPKNQQNPQQQQQDQKQDQKQDPQQQQENKQPSDPSSQAKPEKQEKQDEPQPKEQDQMSEEKARALLEKATLREKEYQDEKQKRAFFDRAPVERDW